MRQPDPRFKSVSCRRFLSSLLFLSLFAGNALGQDIGGTYQFIGVHVGYTEVVRDSASAADSSAVYEVTASWPSSAAAAVPGGGFTIDLEGFGAGDTIAVFETPAALLSPAGLSAFGISLDLALTSSSLLIPGIEGNDATYPTTSTINCSTGAVIADVSDDATISLLSTENSLDSTAGVAGSFTWGFGITASEVFDWFVAPSDWEDPNTYAENWGILTGFFDVDNTVLFDTLEVFWRAIDGAASNIGIDTEGKPNRVLGVATVPGDTVTVGALGLNVGTYPILGGSGIDHDSDPSTPNIGIVEDVNWGYLFDPVGVDNSLFSGDEPLQFTGYYFTNNFLTTVGTFEATLVAQLGGGANLATALTAAVDAALQAIGANATLAATVGAVVADSVAAWIGLGVPDSVAFEKAPVFALGTALVLDTLLNINSGFNPDDSDHDYNLTNGRLIFEIDNNCIPTTQTREVTAFFFNIADTGDTTVNVVDSDFSTVPEKFAVHNNFPNPFNPSTHFSFDLPAMMATEVTVWNLLGQQVRTLHTGELPAGQHTARFDGRNDAGQPIPSGVYFYRVQAGQFVSTHKMMLLK